MIILNLTQDVTLRNLAATPLHLAQEMWRNGLRIAASLLSSDPSRVMQGRTEAMLDEVAQAETWVTLDVVVDEVSTFVTVV